MSLHLCCLASGSSGNATLIWSEQTAILLDAGLSAREIARRMEPTGVSPDALRAICVSHEHSDHTAGLRVLHQRHGVPLYGNHATIQGIQREDEAMKSLEWKIFTTGQAFAVGDLRIEPFSVPHDAHDPVGFIVQCGAVRVGVVTDIGMPTTLVRERLRHCHALVVESNHDERLLQDSKRPWSLKQRIMGRQGHLSNRHAGELLAAIASPVLQHVYLAHLSTECNREDIAMREVRHHLDKAGFTHVRVEVAAPNRISTAWAFAAAPPVQ